MSGVAGCSSPRSTLAARSVETEGRDDSGHSPGSARGSEIDLAATLLDRSWRPPDRQPNRGAASSSSI